MCSGKSSYTKKEAQSNLNALIESGRWNKKEVGRIYHCNSCNFYHITHAPEKKPKTDKEIKIVHAKKWRKLLKKQKR